MLRIIYLLPLALLLSACEITSAHMQRTEQVPAARQDAQNALHYFSLGQTEIASPLFARAESEAPDDPLVLDALAYYHEKLSDTKLANNYYTKARLEAPYSPTIAMHYGTFLCRHGYSKQGIPVLLEAAQTKNYPGAPEALANARACNEHLHTGLGGQDESAYYTPELWAPLQHS